MPPYYYHLKLELYATPDPTATAAAGNSASKTTRDDIWVPAPGASIFDDLPAHPLRQQPQRQQQQQRPTTSTTSKVKPKPKLPQRWAQWGLHDDNGDDRHADGDHGNGGSSRSDDRRRASTYAAAAGNTRVIDCGAQRGRAHDTGTLVAPTATVVAAAEGAGGGGSRSGAAGEAVENGGLGRGGGSASASYSNSSGVVRRGERQRPQRTERSPPPGVADGIGPGKAVRDWRFGRVRIESFDIGGGDTSGGAGHDVEEEMAGKLEGGGGGEATPAASLGPNLGGMGLATKARYVPLGTKNTEAGWGVVHLYREGDEESALKEVPESVDGPGEGNSKGQEGSGGEEEGTILCIPAVPSYMSPSDFLGFIGEKWRGYVSHYRMVMTSRMNRYMVLMKFRDYRRAREWRKEFDGKPFDSVEVSSWLSTCVVPMLTI